ncbi:hypothetical protein Ddye_005535 [Dipteronia dyeriana]|uniref:N-acetyltransferase domain-containing protein n=1 Tax=Dipteronia dyeriana TaxID=168575 RepID=A0AAD9XGR0_9ROSI|nr:hypothetical protein Ddye_005535 [Dipteronia dyeriana]
MTMAHMLVSYPSTTVICGGFSRGVPPWEKRQSRAVGVVQCCCSCSSTEGVGVFGKVENESKRSKCRSREIKEIDNNINNKENDENKLDCLMSEFGWEVSRLVVEDDEMRRVSFLQAQAFHIPVFLFNDLFFDFFQAEVLSGLLYKLKNSPPNRYACLVAEPATNSIRKSQEKLVGVVDVTVQRDAPVLQHLQGAQEYLYISGLAVSKSFRRQKIASVLLKACDMLAILWGYEYLVLRAYEEDLGAQKLYSKAGYQVVSSDPPWLSSWIRRKRRVLLIKQSNI